MPAEPIAIGQRIRQYRLQRGLTQMELAERIGVSYQQVQKYEQDRSQITLQRLYRLAEALDVPLVALVVERRGSRVSEGTGAYGDRAAGITREEQAFLRLFEKIKNPGVRRSILRLLESLAQSQDKS